jgi:hypothetical protein
MNFRDSRPGRIALVAIGFVLLPLAMLAAVLWFIFEEAIRPILRRIKREARAWLYGPEAPAKVPAEVRGEWHFPYFTRPVVTSNGLKIQLASTGRWANRSPRVVKVVRNKPRRNPSRLVVTTIPRLRRPAVRRLGR